MQIDLPLNAKVLKNGFEQKELPLPDYTLDITLELNKQQVSEISNQIKDVPFFDELAFLNGITTADI